jgi:PTS system ascorbate-specific IIC component
MFLGFIASLFIARLTPLRYVFLTGHHILYMSTMLAVILVTVELTDIWTVLVGAILLGTIMVVMPAFAQPWMRKVTGGEAVAMGHFGSTGYILGGIIGQATPRSKSTEEMNFPQQLRFLRDPMVATAVSMVFMYMIFALAYLLLKGESATLEAFTPANQNWGSFLMAQFLNALNFGVGVAIILLGVRTILGEIVPAFAGISERIIPGALPALDCPVAFPYAPNAVILGFVASVAGGLVSLAVISTFFQGGALALALILPGMVPHFFTGGTAGVFGNATGGRIGATLGGFANGVLITFLPAFLLKVMGDLGFANTTFGDADFGWYGIVVGNVATWVKGNEPVIIGAMLVISVVLIALGSLWQVKVVNSGWIPGGAPKAKEEAAA